jgi:Phage tail protein (Tail_P2_I)
MAPITPIIRSFIETNTTIVADANYGVSIFPGQLAPEVDGNVCQSPTAGSWASMWRKNLSFADAEVYCDLVGGPANCVICLRLQNPGGSSPSYYELKIVLASQGQWELNSTVNGTTFGLAQSTIATAVNGLWLKAFGNETNGGRLQAWLRRTSDSIWQSIFDHGFSEFAANALINGAGTVGLFTSAGISPSIGIRNWGGGDVSAASVVIPPGIVKLDGVQPFPDAEQRQIVPPAIITLPGPPLKIAQTMSVPPAIIRLTGVSAGSSARMLLTPATIQIVGAPVTGRTDVPPRPPEPEPEPEPPPPPPDPRDVPMLDGPFTYLMYEAMSPLAFAEADLGYPMLRFFKSIAYNVHEIYAMITENGVPWSLSVSVDEVPSRYLDWLAQFVGVSFTQLQNLTSQQKRLIIKDAPGWKRGTPAAMVAAAQITLTGNKTVTMLERIGDDGLEHAYHLIVITYGEETPDPAKTLQALIAAKPAGIQMSHVVRTGQIWLTLRDEYDPPPRFWTTVKTEYTNWQRAKDKVPGP